MQEQIDPRHLLAAIAETLKDLDIPYAITGGMAIYVWGRPRFTADIDVIVQLYEKDVGALSLALKRLSKASYVDTEMMQWALERKGEFNFIDGASGIKVDFWVLKKGEFEENQLRRRIGKKVLNKTVFFVSPEDLILSKLRWYTISESSRQLEDVESILKIQRGLDWKYLSRWSKVQKTFGILSSLRKRILKK